VVLESHVFFSRKGIILKLGSYVTSLRFTLDLSTKYYGHLLYTSMPMEPVAKDSR